MTFGSGKVTIEDFALKISAHFSGSAQRLEDLDLHAEAAMVCSGHDHYYSLNITDHRGTEDSDSRSD